MAKTPRPRAKRAPARTPRLPNQIVAAVSAIRDKKGTAVTVLDLRKTGAFTDYFLICSGANPRQVHAIADGVEEALKAKKIRPTHVEGYQRAEWILLDVSSTASKGCGVKRRASNCQTTKSNRARGEAEWHSAL
jgi:ribosome silencing factor RsfS/YbeB/iojap